MDRKRTILSWFVHLLALPLVVIGAVLLAVLLGLIFYLMTTFALVRWLFGLLQGRLFFPAVGPDNIPAKANPASAPSRALVDG